MYNTIKKRLEKLETAFRGQFPTGLTLAWWKENNHLPLEQWPISDEERATIRTRLAKVDETMTAFEVTENDYADE